MNMVAGVDEEERDVAVEQGYAVKSRARQTRALS